MLRNLILGCWLIGMIPGFSTGQQVFHFVVNQPDKLVADAGSDQVAGIGFPLPIGGNPSASGGTAPYQYLWQPGTGLNNPTASNPVFFTDTNRTYTLTVTDQQGCTAQSTVNITVLTSVAEAGKSTDCPCSIMSNPVRGDVVSLYCDLPGFEERELIVRTITGHVLLRQPIQNGKMIIDLSSPEASSGLLIFTITGTAIHHIKVVRL